MLEFNDEEFVSKQITLITENIRKSNTWLN